METWNRRSVLATGAFIAVGTGVATGKPTRTDEPSTAIGADGWSSVDGGPRNARRAPAIDTPDTIAWRYEGGGEPVVVDGTVYFGGDTVRALDATDGSLEWETGIDGRSLGLTVAGDTVYAGGAELVALDAATGDRRWSTAVDTDDIHAPLLGFGTAYVLGGGSLYAIDADDGSHRWERDTVTVNGQPMPFGTSSSQLVATQGAVWAVLEGSGSDGLAELDPETGETRWSGLVDSGTGGLAATEETLLVENNSLEGVYTFDPETKETEDKISDAYVTAADAGVAVTQGRYEVEATALGGADATEGWSHGGSYAHGLPVIAGDTVVVTHSTPGPDAADSIVGFDLADGSERWRFEFDDGESWTDGADAGFLVVEDGTIYAQRGTDLVAVRPESWTESDSDDTEDETNGDEEPDPEDGDGNDGSDGDDEYGPDEDGDGSDDADGADDGENDDGASDDTGTGNGGADDANGGTGDTNGTGDDADGTDDMPGFTAGAGVAGGALGLEWLRRRAGTDDHGA